MYNETGVQIEKAPGRRNFSDSKTKISKVGNGLSTCIEGSRTDKKRKAATLTVDNADVVFAECFDFDMFTRLLHGNPNILNNRELIYNSMKASIIDSKVVPFTSVSERHLNLLGIDIIGDLEVDPNSLRALDLPDSMPNTILRQDVVASFKKHFSQSKESGCRCIIDQFLLAAAIYAQHIIDTDTDIRNGLFTRYLIRKPHVAVFTELPIPKTTISHHEVSYIFHGFLDYGVGLIKSGDKDALEDGRYKLGIEKTLTSVIEAKSLDEMQGTHAQIIMQVLTALVLTDRTTFTGALSNGAMWRFYTAQKDEEFGYRVYSSDLYSADKHGGLIVELLKDMILYEKSPLITTLFDTPAMRRLRTV